MGSLVGTRKLRGRRSAPAFTLIEILVVLVVLGIVASAVAISMAGDDRRDLQREAKRLAGALEHAAALAQWSGETLGVSAEGSAYRFWRRDANDQWSAYGGDEILAPRALPAGLTVNASSYAGAPVPPDAVLPFRASGRNEPYEMALVSQAGSVVVSADPLNRVAFATQTVAQEPMTLNPQGMPVARSPDKASMPPPRDGPGAKHEGDDPRQRR